MPSYEQAKGLFRAPQTCTKKNFAKIVNNVNLELLTILEKRINLDAWLSPACASAGGYNIVLKIQSEISHWQQVKIESF